jgi:hypothetical protein
MLTKKYNTFRRAVKEHLRILKNQRKKKISKSDFDGFIKGILAEDGLFLTEEVYCRDGFTYIHEIDRNTFQVVSFQVNSFGAGIFGDSVKVLCTPILLTVKVTGSHHYLDHSLKGSCLSIDDFYLGKSFSGSKGPLCNRDAFNRYAKIVFLSEGNISSFNHNIIYQIMNANYLCHHIAEVMGYAFGGLDLFWSNKQNSFFLSSGARFNKNRDKLYIDIIEDFSGEKMRGYSQIPHYAVLMNDIKKFKEEFDLMEWEVTYRGVTETFMLPVGYQKLRKKMFHMNVNVITTQHIIEQVLTEYYHRKNVFVVANTFQTLEYLSRAMVARADGLLEEGGEFIKEASLCLGHYPERDFIEFYRKREDKYPSFISDYSHTMFFRPPILT